MVNSLRFERPTYTPEQLEQYFERISLPQKHRDHPVTRNKALARTKQGLEFLAILQKYQLSAVPFESLSLHYSPQRKISVNADDLFDKIVAGGMGRGGYCMETDTLFATVLRSLGYQIFSSGARVNDANQPVTDEESYPGPSYMGWNHMVNIVTIENQRYLVDVGFGASGPHHPVALIPEHIEANVGTQMLKLSYESIPDNEDTSHKLWVYKYRHTESGDWTPGYCFTEVEFLPHDFVIMNAGTSSGHGFHQDNVLCGKMIMDNEVLVGDLTLLNQDLKRRIQGVSKVLVTVETEQERVEVLEKYLGVKLTLNETKAICGFETELR